MTAGEFVGLLERYAGAFGAPVRDRCGRRLGLPRRPTGTSSGRPIAPGGRANVVIATGWCDRPRVPALARSLTRRIHQVAPADYRRPGQLPDGGVLVVGASATGVQLADELRAAGRDVTLAVGRHSRLPRRYRGHGHLLVARAHRQPRHDDRRAARPGAGAPRAVAAARRPSRPPVVDLTTLQAAGVRLAGRLTAADGRHVRFAPDLGCTTAAADRRLRRVLGAIDGHIASTGLADEVLPPEPVPSLAALADARPARPARRRDPHRRVGHRPPPQLPLAAGARARRRRRDPPAARRHARPGLYVLGQRFQHFRSSNFIDGVGRDAAFVADHLTRRAAITRRH